MKAAMVLAVLGAVAALGLLVFTVATAPQSTPMVIKDVPLPDRPIVSADGSGSVAVTSASLDASGAAVEIEVPNVVGKPVRVAEALVSAAGLTVQTHVADEMTPGRSADEVVRQWPEAGVLLQAGSTVAVTYQPQATATAAGERYVVVIDAGHQKRADLTPEPIGPGSAITKAKVSVGGTGVASGMPEYRLALSIAQKLQQRLESKGIKVVMVRTGNDVDIPNSRRARIGNAAKADLVVRIHMDTNNDPAMHGVSVLYPSGNAWVRRIASRSKVAASAVLSELVAATGATSRGIYGRGDMSGFNYSTRPVIIAQCGFLSNAAEDERVVTPVYQGRIADGLSAGVIRYLKGH